MVASGWPATGARQATMNTRCPPSGRGPAHEAWALAGSGAPVRCRPAVARLAEARVTGQGIGSGWRSRKIDRDACCSAAEAASLAGDAEAAATRPGRLGERAGDPQALPVSTKLAGYLRMQGTHAAPSGSTSAPGAADLIGPSTDGQGAGARACTLERAGRSKGAGFLSGGDRAGRMQSAHR
jgi:hypothetical protein